MQVKKRVGIIRGGNMGDYDTSLKNGGELISYIFENLSDKYKIVDIFIDKNGIWHIGGIKTEIESLPNKIDVAWNVSHPNISNSLRSLSIPLIDRSPFSFLLKHNHDFFQNQLKDLGIKTPKRIILPLYQADLDGDVENYVIQKAKEIHQKFGAPWIVKSFNEDKDMGIHVAKTFPELIDAILDGVVHRNSILVEEFIIGKNTSMHSVSGFRGQDIYLFPPENMSKENKIELERLTTQLHKHLGVENYLKTDFTIHPKRGIFLTDIDFHPELKENSDFHKNCESVGAKMHHIVEHLIDRVLA